MNMCKNGFTLIELVMVIAILAIISTLAVGKFGQIQKKAARQVSIANQQNIGRIVDSHVLVNHGGLNRLDALVNYDCATVSSDGFGTFATAGLYTGPDSAEAQVREKNSGLSPELLAVLCTYKLNEAESLALGDDLGVKFVMRHWRKIGEAPDKGDDGSVVTDASVAADAELSACVATTNEPGLVCAAITGMNDAGRAIYRDCGQDMLATDATLAAASVREEIAATGGALLAFGLGDSASIIGSTHGGIDAAPFSEVVQGKYYRRYILLVRLVPESGGGVSAEVAGVLDPEGNTIRKARLALK